jgi:threonylcarbamoyladenosine tRNA methylthiotransferase MtaB
MKVSILTLGCKTNQFESQALETMLLERGHILCSPEEPLDALIINTCAVTAESAAKSRRAAAKAVKNNPDAIVALCGCWPQISPEEAKSTGAHLIYGSGDRAGFLRDLERAHQSGRKLAQIDDAFARREFEKLPAGSLSGRTRAMLKVQDGCQNFCAYCVIPYARGRVRSLSLPDAVSEAKRLYEQGIKELVLTGIEISSYGKDLDGGETLADLVSGIGEAVPDMRLRIGSLEPRVITAEFCGLLSGVKNLCEHFHISLQSGCDRTLMRMRRRYDTALVKNAIGLIRQHFPGCGLTADLIAGFPGETEEEFSETLDFIKSCAFSSMHIFPYSRRPGTPAFSMKEQVPKAVKRERCSRASSIAQDMKLAFLKSCVGTVQSVLFESGKDGSSFGHTRNYCLIEADAENLTNQIKNVLVTGIKNGHLFGELSG